MKDNLLLALEVALYLTEKMGRPQPLTYHIASAAEAAKNLQGMQTVQHASAGIVELRDKRRITAAA